MKEKVIFELELKAKFFIPELIARLAVTLFIFFTYGNFNSKDQLIFECLGFCLLVNVIISVISIYYGYRRAKGIKETFVSRLSNQQQFKNHTLEFISNQKTSDYTSLAFLQGLIFSISICLEPFLLSKGHSDYSLQSIIISAAALALPAIYTLIFVRFRNYFINHKVVSATVKGQKLSEEEVLSITKLFEEQPIESLHYLNDMWIISYRRKLNEFRQRVDTLLIEAVFIGTLTFATFVQLTSPESISSLPLIQKAEDANNNQQLNDSSISKQEFIILFNNYYATRNADTTLNQYLINNFPKSGNIIINPKSANVGYFQNWVTNRKLTILKSYFLARNNKNWFFQQITDGDSLLNIHDYEMPVNSLNNLINALKKDLPSKITNDIFSEFTRDLIHWNLAQKIDNLPDSAIGSKIDPNTEHLLACYSNIGFAKYKSLIKHRWDEQEYLFLIAIGSILCSICFIAVLLKRFPIIVGLENFASEISKASIWNNREEQIQLKKMEFDIESNIMDSNANQTVIEKYEERREHYTERLQSQLAMCELQSNRLETNINTISILRTLGLFIFYFVLSISTLMIDYAASVILFVILTYSIFGAQIMNDGSFVYWLYRRTFKKNAIDNTIFSK